MAATIDITDIKTRLTQLGYTPAADEDDTITYVAYAVEAKLKAQINRSTIPESLDYVRIDMTCGEFLQQKYLLGKLTAFDLDAAASTISEGDTTITFNKEDSADTKVGKMITWLLTHGESEIIACRRIKW